MDAAIKEKFEARAKIMKAMAHPTRLFIVDELSRNERCVCDLTEMVGADTSTVSKHLSVLKNAGLVEDESEGRRFITASKCRASSIFSAAWNRCCNTTCRIS